MSGSLFTLRKSKILGADGDLQLYQTFYISNDSFSEALDGIFHCFAYGDSLWRKSYSVHKEIGPYISFNFYQEGGADIEYERRKYHVEAGDMLIAQFRNSFTIRTGRAEGFAKKQCLLLSYTPLQSAIVRTLFPEDLSIIHLPEPEKIIAILDAVGNEVKGDGDRGKLSHLILDFLQELRRQRDFHSCPEELSEALRYIARPGNENVSRDQLAKHCNISISTLNRMFLRYLKISPGQYILQRKLDNAARLLSMDSMSVKQAAYETGFSTPAFFTRIFKKHYGMTPKEFQIKGR